MLLEIDNLDVSFRNDEGDVVNAAIDVDITLDRGEILGIVGESGSGKSSVGKKGFLYKLYYICLIVGCGV